MMMLIMMKWKVDDGWYFLSVGIFQYKNTLPNDLQTITPHIVCVCVCLWNVLSTPQPQLIELSAWGYYFCQHIGKMFAQVAY